MSQFPTHLYQQAVRALRSTSTVAPACPTKPPRRAVDTVRPN